MGKEKSFSEKVYQVVFSIPKGQVLTYKEVAKRVGNEKAYHAVGIILSNHRIKNLPCHRVIKSNGEVGNYQWGKDKKIALLKKEGIKINLKGKISY